MLGLQALAPFRLGLAKGPFGFSLCLFLRLDSGGNFDGRQTGPLPANAFLKMLAKHAAMVALYFMFFNFGRVHQTLRVTPAMEAGVANHVWSIAEIVALLD